MSSTNGAWETVGKPSKKSKVSNGGKKAGKAPPPGVRLEDVLPLKQVNSWYANVYETPSSSESEPDPTSSSLGPAKKAPAKKAPAKEGPPPLVIPRKPSNVSDAAALVIASDLKEFVKSVQSGYPDMKELWVREIAVYLNGSLDTSEKVPSFIAEPFSDLPSSALFKEVKKTIQMTLEECNGNERQNVFDSLLANVAHYAVKGKPVNGYLTVIQVLLEAYPHLCHGNVSKFSELRHSYQNQPPICLNLLWAVGQGGRRDLKVGLKAWIEIMVTLLPLKHYHKFIVHYLNELLLTHQGSNSPAGLGGRLIPPSIFMQFLCVFFTSGPASLNKPLLEVLNQNYPTIKALALGDGTLNHELFPLLMRRLTSSEINDAEKSEIINLLRECVLNATEATLSQWMMMYTSFPHESALLLESLASHIGVLPKRLLCSKSLKDSLETFRDYNLTVPNTEDIKKASKSCHTLLSKMCSMESKEWFPWKTFSFILIIIIGCLLRHDVNRSLTVKVSNTGMLLSDIGLFDPLSNAFECSRSSLNAGLKHMDELSPQGMKMLRDGCNDVVSKTGPLLESLRESGSKKLEFLVDYANEKTPWLKAQASYWAEEAMKLGQLSLDWCQEKAPIVKEQVLAFAHRSFESLKGGVNQVLGNIEIEDVKKYTQEKFSASAKICMEGYHSAMHLVKGYLGM